MKDNNIYFLVGPVRSGSTLLKLMLDSHPQIVNPGECDFLFDFIDDDGSLPQKEKYLDYLKTNRTFRNKGLNIDNKLNVNELLIDFVEQFKQDDKVLIMNLHHNLHRAIHIFPNAKFIHLLRDPRDVARSCVGMGWVGHVYFGADIWKRAEDSWNELAKMLSEKQYFEIKYEKILNDVESGLSTICSFMNLGYAEEMLDYSKNSTYSSPDKSLCFQWKRKYSEHELRLVEGKIGKAISARGYELSGLDTIKPGFSNRVALNLLNKKFRIKNFVKKYGIGLFFKYQIATRLNISSWKRSAQEKINSIDKQYLK